MTFGASPVPPDAPVKMSMSSASTGGASAQPMHRMAASFTERSMVMTLPRPRYTQRDSWTGGGRRHPYRDALIDHVIGAAHRIGRGRLDIPHTVGAHRVVVARAGHPEILRGADQASGVVRI